MRFYLSYGGYNGCVWMDGGDANLGTGTKKMRGFVGGGMIARREVVLQKTGPQ